MPQAEIGECTLTEKTPSPALLSTPEVMESIGKRPLQYDIGLSGDYVDNIHPEARPLGVPVRPNRGRHLAAGRLVRNGLRVPAPTASTKHLGPIFLDRSRRAELKMASPANANVSGLDRADTSTVQNPTPSVVSVFVLVERSEGAGGLGVAGFRCSSITLRGVKVAEKSPGGGARTRKA